MTTGEPVVVRAAMKPLPTLTKPLRSVDIETKQPAEALRERTDSCTVPAAGVVGEAMVALELAAPIARSSAATRWPTCSRRWTPTESESNGGGDGAGKAPAVPWSEAGESSSSSASWAPASRPPRAGGRAGSVSRRSTATRCSRSSSASRSQSFFDREGEARSANASRRWCSSCSSARARRRCSLGRRSGESEAVRAALARTRLRVRGRRRRPRVGARASDSGRPLARDRERVRAPARAAAAAVRVGGRACGRRRRG